METKYSIFSPFPEGKDAAREYHLYPSKVGVAPIEAISTLINMIAKDLKISRNEIIDNLTHSTEIKKD